MPSTIRKNITLMATAVYEPLAVNATATAAKKKTRKVVYTTWLLATIVAAAPSSYPLTH